MAIKSKFDKSLPSNMNLITKEMKNLKGNLKELREVEKLYSKQKELKKALNDNKTQYKANAQELRKLKKAKDGNKKLTKSQEKEYRRLKSEMKKLGKTIDKQKIKNNEYKIAIRKTGISHDEVTNKIKKQMKEMDKLNKKQAIFKKAQNFKGKIKGGLKKGATMAGKAAVGLGISGTLAVGAFGATSAKSYIEFSGQMKRVQALSRATTEEFKIMENEAIRLGSTTSFTSQQVGEGMEYLALAGFKTNEIVEAMPGLLNLATASGEDLGVMADIVSDNISAFGLSVKDTSHFANVMALASSSTNTTVGMLGEAFSYAAAPAKALGVSLEETTAILGIMANNGIKGAKGGTALRSALLSLSAPTKEAKEAIYKLGLQTKDKDGNFIGMGNIISQLQKKFKGLTDVQQAAYAKSLFGKNAVSGLLTVINSAPGEIDNLTKALEDSEGAAQKMADTMLEGPEGAMKLLSSSWDGLKKTIGKGIMGEQSLKVIKSITSYISELSNVINGSFNDNPANAFWQNIFKITKLYIEKFKTAFIPLIQSLKDMFIGINIKEILKEIVKFVIETVLVIINLVGKIMKFLKPVIKFVVESVIKFLIKHGKKITVFLGAFLIIGKIVGIVTTFVGAIGSLIAAVSAAGGVIATLGTVMGALGGPIVWIGALLVTIGYLIYKNWNQIKKWGANIKSYVIGIFNGLPEPIKNFFIWLGEIWISAFNNIIQIYLKFKDGSINLAESLKQIFETIANSIIDSWALLFTFITDLFIGIFPEEVQGFLTWFRQGWINLFKWYIDVWIGVFNNLKEIFIKFKNGNITFVGAIKETFMIIPNTLKKVFLSTFELIKNKMQDIKSLLKLPEPPAWILKITSKMKNEGIDGSHYNGLANVPYDGYIAELHKGERVLTAGENEEYSNRLGVKLKTLKGSSKTTTTLTKNDNKNYFNPTINITVNGSESEENIEDRIKNAVEEQMEKYMRRFEKVFGGNNYDPRTIF